MSAGTTFATTELSIFSNHLPPGTNVSLVTEFTADGESYGYYLGGNSRTVPPSGNLTVHVDLSDVKNGEDDESGTVKGWFYASDHTGPGYGPPIIRTDGQPAEFTLHVH